MAFPIVRSVSNYAATSDSTSHTIPAPSTTVAGDTLVLITMGPASGGLPSADAAWTLVHTVNDTVNHLYFRVYKKSFQTGANGATVTRSTSGRIYAQIYAFDKIDHVEVASTATYQSPNPPLLTLSTSSTSNLYVAVDAVPNANYVSTAPSGYSTINKTGTGNYGAELSSAYKTSSVSSEDPGAFGGAPSSLRTTATIGIFLTPPFVPTTGSISFTGYTPIVNAFTGRPNQGAITFTGLVPAQFCSFVGNGYVASLNAVIENNDVTFVGRGYKATLDATFGATLEGRGYAAAMSAQLDPDYNGFFTGRGYAASLDAMLEGDWGGSFAGRGYKADLLAYGGTVFTGRGYSVALNATVETSELLTFIGRGYNAALNATATPQTDITFVGRGYATSLWYQEFIGRGYSVALNASFADASEYSDAFVMNINTTEVTRYTNYPFMHVMRVGDAYYGVKADGLYELAGLNDIDETSPVNGSITTMETDFGAFQSKNVPFVYVNSDADLTVTPIVDSNETTTYEYDSQFSGRKVKLGRGLKGRYWAFKLDNITELQGLEYLPDQLSRRVK